MKQLLTGILALCFIMTSALTGYSQDTDTTDTATTTDTLKAKKMEGHTWHQVVMVKFKPGTMNEAMKIIDNHFVKAGMESGTEGPQLLQLKTGEWDMMMVWTMDSIEDMEWEIHPDDEKWWAAMAEQEGGMDKAMEVMQKYMKMIDNSTTYLATSQQTMSEGTMGSTEQ